MSTQFSIHTTTRKVESKIQSAMSCGREHFWLTIRIDDHEIVIHAQDHDHALQIAETIGMAAVVP